MTGSSRSQRSPLVLGLVTIVLIVAGGLTTILLLVSQQRIVDRQDCARQVAGQIALVKDAAANADRMANALGREQLRRVPITDAEITKVERAAIAANAAVDLLPNPQSVVDIGWDVPAALRAVVPELPARIPACPS